MRVGFSLTGMRPAIAAWLAACLFSLMPSCLAAQLIDTIEDPFVTLNDSVNKRLSLLKGFDVSIISPEKVSGSGVKLKHGFDTYYLHVVKAKRVLVNGEPINNRGEDTYLAIITTDSRPDVEFDSIGGRALFLKGIVAGENPEAKIDFYEKQAKKFDVAADSFSVMIDSLFVVEPWVKKRRDDYRLMASNCRFTAEAYGAFLDAGSETDFFLTHYMNFSDRFNIYTHPYGLPEVKPPPPPPEEAAAPARKRKKSFWKKLAFWK
jgi:hypothetical protein